MSIGNGSTKYLSQCKHYSRSDKIHAVELGEQLIQDSFARNEICIHSFVASIRSFHIHVSHIHSWRDGPRHQQYLVGKSDRNIPDSLGKFRARMPRQLYQEYDLLYTDLQTKHIAKRAQCSVCDSECAACDVLIETCLPKLYIHSFRFAYHWRLCLIKRVSYTTNPRGWYRVIYMWLNYMHVVNWLWPGLLYMEYELKLLVWCRA